jgi:uncharacterized protein (TIGR00251 family)
VRVVPRAPRDEIAGFLADGTLRVRLTAPPVEGRANEALIRLLAEALDVPRSRVRIAGGAGSRSKVVSIGSMTPEEAKRRLGERKAKRG